MNKPIPIYRENAQSRRRITEAYRKLAEGRRFKPAERVEFARMAEAWAATLPKE